MGVGVSAGSKGNQSAQELNRPRARYLGYCRAREGRLGQAQVPRVWPLGAAVGQAGQAQSSSVSWASLERAGARSKSGGGQRIRRNQRKGTVRRLQAANDQKDRCPQLHQASRPGATSGLT